MILAYSHPIPAAVSNAIASAAADHTMTSRTVHGGSAAGRRGGVSFGVFGRRVMRSIVAPALVPSTAIEGQPRPRRVKFVTRKFGKVAKVIWTKPAAVIASIAKCDIRTGKRILRGEADVPACVLLAACEEMLKPSE